MPSTANPIRDFAMTSTGGWSVVNGDFAVVAGPDAPPQGIAIRLRLFLGEALLDASKGVDYLGLILIKNPDPLVVQTELQNNIEDTPDVVRAISAGLVGPTALRSASIAYQAETIYSATPLDGSVIS